MEKLHNSFRQLENSIASKKIDFQLLQIVKQVINTINLEKNNFDDFVKSMTLIYELSNNDKLYIIKRNSISINQMALELKILVCKMMTIIISYFEKQQSVSLIPFQILSQAIEIMIICARVCLNQASNKYISLIQDFYQFIHSPYQFVSSVLGKNIQFLHQLNVLELIRYRCQNQAFSIVEFKKRLALAISFDEIKILDYRIFVQNIVMEILLKSLKNGKLKPQNLKGFYSYLSQENQKDLKNLVFESDNLTNNIQNGSQFLQIYKQIKDQGIQSINIEFLEDFIKNNQNFNDDRLLQIAALTLQPIILQIWFSVLNSKKQKSLPIQKALMCFIHIVDSILHNNSIAQVKIMNNILKLSNTIIFTLLTQKKPSNSNQPILNIIKTLVKVLTWLCFSLYENWADIKDFGQRTVLLCSKYQCMEISKIIYAVMLYYSLVKKQKAEDIYQKFIAYYSNQKSSEIYKLLSCAYQTQNSHFQDIQISPQLRESIKNQPFIAILFANKNQDMTIFQIDVKQFKEINRKFYIYSEMLKKYRDNEQNLINILKHIQQFLIKIKIEEFQNYMSKSQQQNTSVQQLFLILIQMLQKRQPHQFQKLKLSNQMKINQQNLNQLFQKQIDASQQKIISSQICFILINLFILDNEILANQFKESSIGVLLNKYSMKIKIINGLVDMIKNNKFQLENSIFQICCCYLVTVLEKFKKCSIKKQRIGQPGQVSFVHVIQELVQAYYIAQDYKNKQNQIEIDNLPKESMKKQSSLIQVNKVKKDFLSFTIFQIDCLTKNYDKYFKLVDHLPLSLLKTFTHSVYLPKQLKQKILRKIVRQNFLQAKCDISLKQFREIIQVTEDQQEVQLYMQYVFATFGEEGRKMIMLMANQNKEIQKILLNDTDVQI